MPRLLVIKDTFRINGRGLAVVGPLDEPEAARYRVGDAVEIRSVDGSTRRSTIAGVPISPSRPGFADILLGPFEGDVAPGSELWLIPPG